MDPAQAVHPTPPAPDRSYLEHLAARTERAMAEAEPLGSGYAGAPAEVRTSIATAVGDRAAELVDLSHRLHADPELGYDEHRSVRAVADLLSAAGYEAQLGAYDLPTALRAVAGDGGPRVAVLAEYDALPGIGHACGHNVICASAVGAFLALAGAAGELGGTVELIGTPAEEGGGGKERIARVGGFDGVDAAVMVHPYGYDLAEHPFLGRRVVDVTYHGVAAHAAATPFMGRNALDGVVAAYTGIAALRQHLPSTDRAHGVITDGGQRPNVVPERAAVQFYLRSAEPETLLDLCRRATAVFEGAAAMTGTAVEIQWDADPAYLPIRHNSTLAARYAVHLAERGRQVLPPGIVPETLTGSTDLGNVSVRVPAIHPMLAIAPSTVSMHTTEFAEYAAGPDADRGILDGAVGLACTGADFLADPALREAVAAEFAEAGGPLDVARLLA
jgi:amidohydrolase